MSEKKSFVNVEMNRPMRYTGVRAEEYNTIKAAKRFVSAVEYNKVINSLNRRQRAANKQVEKAAAKREQKAAAERERINRMIVEAKQQKEAPRNVIVDIRTESIPTGGEADTAVGALAGALFNDLFGNRAIHNSIDTIFKYPIIDALKKHKVKNGDKLYLQISQGRSIVESKIVSIDGKNADTMYYNEFFHNEILIWYTIEGVEGNILQHEYKTDDDLEPNTPIRLVMLRAAEIPAKRLRQKYADGGSCVLDALIPEWTKYYENAESESSKKRLRQILNKLNAYKNEFPDGVPEGKMSEIAKTVCRCIVVNNFIGGEYQRFNPKCSKIFNLTNSRRNHVESGKITLDKKYEPVSLEELQRIVKEHNDNGWFLHFDGDIKTGIPRAIKSIHGCWAVYNEDHDIYTEFSQAHNIKSFGLDAIKYSHVNEFIYEGRLINSTPIPLCDNPNDIDDAKHIDLEKAYTQHTNAPFYEGFPCSITHYGKIDYIPEGAIGMFQVVVMKVEGLFAKTGLEVNRKYILTTPEIKYFTANGCEFKILAGAFSSKRFDINYTPELLQKKRYAKWAGKLSTNKSENVYTFKAEKKWAMHLKHQIGSDRVVYFEEQGLCVVRIPKKSYRTTHHIFAFITAYTRLNMFEVMRKIPEENLIKVILDGVYFRGEVPKIDIAYQEKECIKHIGFRDGWYFRSEVDTSNWVDFNPNLWSADGVVVLAGAGGTGKSHSVLSNSCIISPLYVAPTHVLGQKMYESFKKSYITINRLAGIECLDQIKHSGFIPGCVFVDELTMVNKEWIDTVLERYNNAFIFLAGDVEGDMWFQTRNGSDGKFNKIWTPGDKYKTVIYENDYRAKDEELKKLKKDIRAVMRNVFTDGGRLDADKIVQWTFNNCPTVSAGEALAMHRDGDVWIAGTHATNEKLLKRGIVSGYKNKDGSIDFQKGDEKRGSFTIHSFQGLTIPDRRIFVCPDVFEYAMTYTAISRASYINQIVIVK
jgi:hypothetical protein